MDPKPNINISPKIEGVKGELAPTPEEKEIAAAIENFPFRDVRDNFMFLMVWRGLKTASGISLPIDSPDSLDEALRNLCVKAGLYLKFGQRYEKNNKEKFTPRKTYFVASNETDLELFANLWSGDHIGDPEVYRNIGRMSGFPQSAIDTFDEFTRLPEPDRENMKDKLVLTEKEKKELFPPDLFPFSVSFYMSKAHWQSELETIRKWEEETRLLAPSLYQRYVDRLRN